MKHWVVPIAPVPPESAAEIDLALVAASELPEGEDWLSDGERQTLGALRHPARRADWRLGRWTARQAYLARSSRLRPGERLPEPAALAIVAAPDGAPELFLDGSPGELTLTLSHRNGWGLAAVGAGRLALGCDLEWIEPRSDAFVRDYLTPGEQDALARWPEADRPLAANLAWSGKECALKALRAGLRLDTRAIEVDLDRARAATAALDGWRPLSLATAGLDPLSGGWRTDGELLLSWIAARPRIAPAD